MGVRTAYFRERRAQRHARGLCIVCPNPSGRFYRCLRCRMRRFLRKRGLTPDEVRVTVAA